MSNKALKVFAILFALSFLPGFVYAQREKYTINDSWLFAKSATESEIAPNKGWEKVNVPHSFNTDAYVTANYFKGYGWYKRTVIVPTAWQGKQITLRVDGASKYSVVYVNGKEVGSHAGAYTAASYDVTPFLKEGENELLIRVDNAKNYVIPNEGDFTFFGGLYRDVWLIVTESQHFATTDKAADGVYVSIPTVNAQSATVNVRSILVNNASERAGLVLEQVIKDPTGATVQTLKQNITLKAGETQTFNQLSKPIANPQLWTPETPNLYQVISVIKEKKTGKVIDQQKHVTAFRWYRFDGREGFFLNDKPYKLHGVCRHQDQKPIGPALTDDMHRRDFHLMKEMGVNFIRISHYPQDDALLEMCDREGMLVWEEIPIINIVRDIDKFNDICEENLREMIRQHYNHPSVIVWGFMNEIFLSTYRLIKDKTEFAATVKRTEDLARRLVNVIHEEDPLRKTCIAYHGSHDYNTTELNGMFDVYGWNLYQGWYGGNVKGFDKYIQQEFEKYPDQPRIISEYGAGSDVRIHSLKPKPFDFSSEYQQIYLEHYIPTIEKTPYLCGGTAWNFIDFGSAVRNESMPRINNKGLVRYDRTPKDVYYYYKACWRKDRNIVYIGSRDWSSRTGVQKGDQPVIMPVKVFSNMDEVELFMDGKSLGIKKVDNYVACFDVPFKNTEAMGVAQSHNFRAVAKRQAQVAEDVMAINYTAIPSELTAKNMEHLELGVNVGSDCTFSGDISRFTWVPDQPYTPGSWGYVEGKTKETRTQINATDDGPLYQVLLTNLKSYRFDAPAGDYEVELHFADTDAYVADILYNFGSGPKEQKPQNIFSITINGKVVEASFSPAKEVGGYQAVTRRYQVTNSEGNITVDFAALQGKTFLNAIRIRKL